MTKNEALKTLTHDGKAGWLVPVMLTVDVSLGQNQEEAIAKALEALQALGITARETRAW